ncbi:MAG: CDP-alcohol phosphatidyltransferase family protein, partial [Solirubrobacterales bacterium]
LAREFAVTGLRMFQASNGVMSASQYGKIKTVVQSFVVLIVIVAAPATWVDVAVWAMVVVTVVTGLDYFVNTGKRMDSSG